MRKNEMFLVGKIVSTHGIKGELKVKADTSFDRFNQKTLYIKKDNKYEEIVINSSRIHKNMSLITINSLNNINDVLEFVGLNIYTKHNHDELEKDQYYYEDLINKDVYDINKEKLGVVIDILEVPQGVILEVKTLKKVCLIPFVKAFVKEVDEEKIVIETIEGLI